ncbi:YciI family protein [Microbacterium sp. CFBP9034]|uniref:YciI family protein n=1 Tax=Microbacterium sp. CFBP9034 TaxID=3096540 RepID=UPI002A6AA5E7|nr:YciI family protein [Microbacterium sp. CFBP9034]MDY0909545.1 YciI family protein [Microbacterium sp. CFBP9034]
MVTDATPDEERIVGEHVRYLLALKERGILIIAGRTQESVGTFGLTVFEADDEARAREVMEQDPGVRAGLFAASLHPYAVTVARDGLEDR